MYVKFSIFYYFISKKHPLAVHGRFSFLLISCITRENVVCLLQNLTYYAPTIVFIVNLNRICNQLLIINHNRFLRLCTISTL